MNVAGLDLSLTATGVATAAGTTTIKPKTKGVARLVEVRRQVLELVSADLVHDWSCGDCAASLLVVLEGYSMGAQRGSAGVGQMLGELGGVVRVALHDAGIAYVEIPPATLKKYATGKGNANKVEMGVAASKRGDVEFRDDNACDAWWLRAAGLDHIGSALFELPVAQRAALAVVEWPELVAA